MLRRAFALLLVTAVFATASAAEKIRIACIGDSITFGAGVEDREKNNYPKVLGELLGDKYEVKNFGVNGATMLNAGDLPYTKQKTCKDALAFKPDIVVIKLGSNDSKPQNWKKADDFTKDATALVESFQKLDTKPTVYLSTPAPAYTGNFGITEKVVGGEVKPKVEALAKELKLTLIDVHAALSDKPKLFPDQIHPNAAGAKILAETVHKAIAPK
jgi:acyl-CoA thioesterase-1